MGNVLYIFCLYTKSLLKRDFGLSQSGPKGVISDFIFQLWGYMCIYCRWREIVFALRIHIIPPTHPRAVDGPRLSWEHFVIRPLSGRYQPIATRDRRNPQPLPTHNICPEVLITHGIIISLQLIHAIHPTHPGLILLLECQV